MLETCIVTRQKMSLVIYSFYFLFILFYFFNDKKIVYLFTDSSEGEHAEKVDENVTDGMDSDNEVKSVSKRRRLDNREGKPNEEESDEEKPDADEKLGEDLKSIPEEAQNGAEEKHHSEERQAEESSEDTREQANSEDKLDSEGDQETNDVGDSPPKSEKPHTEPSDPSIAAGNPEISDDEPLVCISGLAISI